MLEINIDIVWAQYMTGGRRCDPRSVTPAVHNTSVVYIVYHQVRLHSGSGVTCVIDTATTGDARGCMRTFKGVRPGCWGLTQSDHCHTIVITVLPECPFYGC